MVRGRHTVHHPRDAELVVGVVVAGGQARHLGGKPFVQIFQPDVGRVAAVRGEGRPLAVVPELDLVGVGDPVALPVQLGLSGVGQDASERLCLQSAGVGGLDNVVGHSRRSAVGSEDLDIMGALGAGRGVDGAA